ncbi:phage tail protein [Marinomonas gallaica]|uniref:phage tail-collar fiber domain-containing protein n=1 Tax=Marinomonas gallaica TaxID=1806667 RepID=UPI003CE4BF14
MANFPGLIMTAAGRNLQAKAQTGQPLNFSRVAIGDGEKPANYEPLVALVDEKLSLNIVNFELLGDGTSKLHVLLTNQNVVEGFFIREIGVMAIDPDTGDELLYSYSNAEQYSDFLPAFGGETFVEMLFDLITVVGNASNVTAVIDDFLAHATKADVDALKPFVVPVGGQVDMLLKKATNADGDTEWYDPTEGIQFRIGSVTEERTAVEGQTAFALMKTLTNGLAVYVNGLRIPNSDWSSAGGSQVVLDEPLNDGDKVQFVNNEEVSTASLARVSLNGPNLVYQGTSNDYTITDYDTFSTYTVMSNIGTATHSNGVITLDIPAGAESDDGIMMTVQRNSGSMSFSIALGTQAVAQPQITSPEHNATDVGETLTLTASAFQTYPAGVDTQASATWRIATDAAMTNVIWESVDDIVNLTAIKVPSGVLAELTEYYTDVEQTGNAIGTSIKSNPIKFTTSDQFVPTVPGTPFGGGYYVGIMDPPDGPRYALIVAPKSVEVTLQYKNSDSFSAGTGSLWDGQLNTSNIDDAVHPVAQYVSSLSIGGYHDWYVPARDEFEVLYRKFKLSTDANKTGARPLGGYFGENLNSVPVGDAYSGVDPVQTSVSDFIVNGSESLESTFYWTSSQYDSNGYMWVQYAINGDQTSRSKVSGLRVRPVRRILLD